MAQVDTHALVDFLNEAARYFERRDTGGEDSAFWSNVANAENCRKAAARLAAVDAVDQERQAFANLNAKLKADNKEMGYAFDARWGATRRATERWQAANPGNDLTWPDHADLVVWCLDKVVALENGLRGLLKVVENQPRIAKLLPVEGSPLAIARALVSRDATDSETQASLPLMDHAQTGRVPSQSEG